MSKLAVLLVPVMLLSLLVGAAGCGEDKKSPTPTSTPSPTTVPTATPAPTAAPTPTPEPITLKLGHSIPPGHNTDLVAQEFARLVEEYTEGRVLVDIYPNGALFGAEELWEALHTGSMDAYVESSWWIQAWVPDVYAFFTDGLWESWEHGYAVMEDGRVPQALTDLIEAAGDVKVLRVLPAGLMLGDITKDREITHLKDLDGLRTNTSPGTPPMPIHEYAGLTAVPIAMEETSIAFMQGIIDSVTMTPTVLRQGQFYETGKHIFWRPGSFRTNLCLMNSDTWESLPVDIREILMNQVGPELESFSQGLYEDSEAADIEFLGEQVETVNWMTPEKYWAAVQDIPITKLQLLMISPRILDVIQELRPSAQ